MDCRFTKKQDKIRLHYDIVFDESDLSSIKHADFYWSSRYTRNIKKKFKKKTGNNLLMAISFDEIIYHKISNINTDAHEFWKFVDEMFYELKKIDNFKSRVNEGKVLILCDNHSST